MTKEQKSLLLGFLLLFFLIPVYGLSHSLSTYNPDTRLSPWLVAGLEIILIIVTYIFFNAFSRKPFIHLKKHLSILASVVLLIFGAAIILLVIVNPSSTVTTAVEDPNYVASSDFQILNGPNQGGEALGKDSRGSDIYKFVIQNNGKNIAKDIIIKIEYFKTQDGSVEDTKYVKLPDTIGSGDTVTEKVAVYTPFDTVSQYWWRATIQGATRVTQ